MRLIDADALDAAFTGLRFSADRTLAHWGDRPDWCLHGSEVEKLIENAPTVGGWISVKDRLPERPPNVDGLIVRRKWFLAALESGVVLSLSYEFDEDRWQGVGSPVTHWMPLPEPPEEAKP